ncbi:MAG TPA: FAD-dependent oxidoreductase [Streptosporangiaceae bacterium]|jgi:pyruvate/2-oxoglutarate dehydrogenase complex dihydrolipoamide dehydrogenase (E3) component
MAEHEVDVVVLGMSPGGETVAGSLAEAGLAVAGVEKRLVGGECPYFGCVPSKMMIRAANLLADTRRVPGMAGAASVTPDWAPVARRIRDEATDTWDDTVAADRFIGKGGELFRGHGRITAPGEVTVGGAVLRASRGVVIAIGTEPVIPPVPGLAGTPYWTNREAIETEQVPESLLVLGGGSIGTELAQTFARFGATVTIIEEGERLLPGDEPEAGALIAGVFGREGITVLTGTRATEVRHDGSRFTLRLDDASQVSGARLLVAAGRRADLAGAGLAAAGLDESADVVGVDGHMRAAPGVWALGDVTGQGAFTHMSMYHAEIIVADVLGREHHPAELHAVPRVTFTDPEIGAVGSTEARARQQGIAVRTGFTKLPQSARGWIHKAGNDGFIKLVADADRGILVGATSAGPAGGEVLSMLTLAVHARVPVTRLDEMIYAYPTFHGAVQDAVRSIG